MNHRTYIKNLLESFVKDTRKVVSSTMFIKHYDTFNITLEEIENMVCDEYRAGLLYHRYAKNDIKEPYEPFVSGIRYFYRKFFSDYTVEEFIDECNVYSLHKDILISYLKTGCATRHELMIISEVQYEKKKFMQSICNCLNYISSRKKLLIVLDCVQQACLSSLHIIREFMNTLEKQDFRLLVIYNEMHMPLPYLDEEFNAMVDQAERYSILFEWDGMEENMVNDYHVTFIPSSRYFSEYLLKLNNLFHMLAIEDVEHYMQIIHERIVQEKLNIDKTDKFNFYALRAYNYIFSDNINSALLMCERMLQFYDPKKDLYQDYVYNFITALSQMTRIQSDLALRYSEKCILTAERLGDTDLMFRANVLFTSARFCGWKDIFSIDFTKVTIDENIVLELRVHKYYNTLAYYLACGSDNDYDTIQKVVAGEREADYLNTAVQIGTELGNHNFLLAAYTKSIILYTEKGFHKYANLFYEKKLQILHTEKNNQRMANLLLGMGYNEIVSEQYIKANEYFNQAFEILYSLKNVEAMAEGLYNMAVNGICCRDYSSAAWYLQNIFKIINNLGNETIRICNASKLYGVMALANYRIGNEYRCYLCLSKIEILLSHLLTDDTEQDYEQWHEDLFLFYFVKGIMLRDNGELEEALECFRKAEFHYDSYPGAKFYTTVEYVTEYVELCGRTGNEEKAGALIDEALRYCNENGYSHMSKNIMYTVEGKGNKLVPVANNLTTIRLEQMIELSVNAGREKQLEERKKDIRFLSAWQEMLNRDELDEDHLINNAMVMIQNNFNLDGIIIINRHNEQIEPLYKSSKAEISQEEMNQVFEFFDLFKREFITSRTDRTFLEYGRIVSVFGINQVVTVAGIPLANETGIYSILLAYVNMHNNFRRHMSLLNEENLVIMKTAFVQLGNDLERIHNRKNIDRINQKLNELAITDMLTGLYNRQGFSKNMEEVNSDSLVTILYADLDNFKYYNDTFDHEIGDIILVEFAGIFRRVSEKLGYAVRYGGDEFLVVLKNADVKKGIEVAEEIYREIGDGFVDVVKAHVGKNVEIPKEKRVSCSIGIAASTGCDEEAISETLKKADEALYYIKRSKKGRYIVWEDINAEKKND